MKDNKTKSFLFIAGVLMVGASSFQVKAVQLPKRLFFWQKPSDKMAAGASTLWEGISEGVGKVTTGATDAMYNGMVASAENFGLVRCWKKNPKATTLTLAVTASIATWGIYRVAKARGKKEMARSVAYSIEYGE